jgi:hypothetical protein
MSYQSIIDSLKVTTATKYQELPDGTTFCNVFAQDVMNAMSEPLPGGNCKAMLQSLTANQYPHWRPVGSLQAQDRAKAGYGSIGITYFTRTSDGRVINHVVVIYPTTETVTTRNDIHMSMAGDTNYNNRKITLAWETQDIDKVQYFSYFPSTSETVVAIDTTTDVTKSNGGTYVFETKSAQTPNVTVGTGGVVTLTHSSRDSINGFDLWKMLYVGTSGAAAGIFTAGPGESPLRRFVARVA